ncbi:uncharacterized protein LOC128739826 [Sabethes cyaneus]|uniref:uncharacterized protein LOC128739826 n=1 Tax=Sabethes cyaneus TaxID=53552 RepID=UPI00237E2299|nr:uncharacterized protein LOC128739826 [Sabethes cyaneus]
MIEGWMAGVNLRLAHHKTEAVMISNRKAALEAKIIVGGQVIVSKRSVKYLSVMADNRLNFTRHVDFACGKASTAVTALSKIMPNCFGPSSSKRRLMVSVAMSVLRYGAPVWAPTLDSKCNQACLNKVFRLLALRVVCGYRTISLDAIEVIAAMIPICILLGEAIEYHRQRSVRGARDRAGLY